MADIKSLEYKKTETFKTLNSEKKAEILRFAGEYMSWLDRSKTERESTTELISMFEKAGYRKYSLGDRIEKGDRFYYNNRCKNLFAVAVGDEPIENGVRIIASHIDSPRLDLKPFPVFESDGIGYFKTHYYGGIRKYQWTTIPLAIHGVVTLRDGSTVTVEIGEDDSDPVFCISDLLPHLAKDQNQKKLTEAFTGEGMNIMICSTPYESDDDDEKNIRNNILVMLNDKYGMTEADFISAELTAVPAGRSRDLGLDRWMIGAYGHDDHCCAYPSARALLDSENIKKTTIIVFADKEETGSNGVSGMDSSLLTDLIAEMAKAFGADPVVVRSRSDCLSADVAAAYDPNYSEVFEKSNSALVNCGVAVLKYTGSGGKYSTNDATGEYYAKIRNIFDSNDVIWQSCELGKVDQGGGGTVAKFISQYNIDTIDIGVPVISMHSPFEVISKADLYEAYAAFKAYINN